MHLKTLTRPFLVASALGMYAVSFQAFAKDADSLPDWALGPFIRTQNAQPVIKPETGTRFDCPLSGKSVAWETRHTFNPAATIFNNRICVLYRAEDDTGTGSIGSYTSRCGMAVSEDGLKFTRETKPVLFPADDAQKPFEWTGGCEDPRLAMDSDGTYVITYTQYAGPKGGGWRIGLATSKNLRDWTKHGSPFNGTPFEKHKIKSAGILQKEENGRLVAAKVNNRYWMYFGEESVHVAHSKDLIHWEPVTVEGGRLHEVMRTRDGYFDSILTEVGPPPILTDKGIVLIYNGKNAQPGQGGDPDLGKGAYACGQALFDTNDPLKLIGRLDKPFFKPELAWEKSGQYVAGTTFAEGLVLFKKRWFMYYGCADTFVGMAFADQ